MKDNKGNSVSFRNCLIIFTTNLGCNKDTGKQTGMGFVKTTNGGNGEIMKAIESYFSPEFLGRLDDIVMYDFLPESIIEKLIIRYLDEYKSQCPEIKDLKFTKQDIQEIIKNSEITTRGARGVRKAVKKQIVAVEDRTKDAILATDF